MLSGNSIINQPIISANTTVILGNISSVLIDPYWCRIAAFTIKRVARGPLMVLPWMGVRRIEPDRVLAWATTMIVKAQELFDIRRLLRDGTIQTGMHFQSADGAFLGEMVDFFFDPYSGAVLRYEVAGGSFATGKNEHSWIPALANTNVDKETDTAVLPLKLASLTRLIENES